MISQPVAEVHSQGSSPYWPVYFQLRRENRENFNLYWYWVQVLFFNSSLAVTS